MGGHLLVDLGRMTHQRLGLGTLPNEKAWEKISLGGNVLPRPVRTARARPLAHTRWKKKINMLQIDSLLPAKTKIKKKRE